MKTTREILRNAAELIERNGLARGTFFICPEERHSYPSVPCLPLHQMPMCALGAIGFVASGMPSAYTSHGGRGAVDALRSHLDIDEGHDENTVAEWSDHAEKDVVVAHLRQAAKECK